MSMTTPRDLLYSQAVKPVSIASTAQTRKFLPITSGSYGPTSNNIIRIPINANGFVDLKNGMLRYKLTNTTAVGAYLDGSAGSIISRLNVIGPDGAPLETIDNYNRLYQALCQLERSRDNYQGIQNLLEGASTCRGSLTFTADGTAGQLTVAVNGVSVGTLKTAGASTVWVGPFKIVTSSPGATTNFAVTYRGVTNTIVAGTAESINIGDITFSTSATANAIFLNGNRVDNATTGTFYGQYDSDFDANNRSVALSATTGARFFAHNLLSTLTKLDVLYPAFAVGGGGVVLELTLAPAVEVLCASDASTATTYSVDNVEFIAPLIQYPDSVVQSFKQMVMAQGSVSMSSVSFQNFIYPYQASPSSLSIPLAIRARSLKALYFFFQDNAPSAGDCRASARRFPATSADTTYQLQIGSQYFPASNVVVSTANVAEAVMELEKSVSKLSDVRHGSVFNYDNFTLNMASGGTAMFGIDLEASAISFLENGVNTADNSLTMYLNLNGLQGLGSAGNVYIYAMYDNTISILPNGAVVATH